MNARSSTSEEGAPETDGWPLVPDDAVLMPLFDGALLVSRAHARFCRIPTDDVALVEAVLQGRRRAGDLPAALSAELRRHGFGAPPAAPEPVRHSVQLQVTNGCNLECSYCCTNSRSKRRGEVSFDALCRVAEEVLAAHGPGSSVGILGGEPLLVPWSLDLAERVLDLGLRLTFYTNGTRITASDNAARLARLASRGAEVRVSLAGVTRERCDAESGEPRFDAALAGIRAVAQHGGSVRVDVMLLPGDVADVATHLPALRAALPSGVRLSFGVLYVSGRERGAHVFRSRAELDDALDRIALEAAEVIPGTPRSPVAPRRDGCSCALGHHLHVRSDGALFTCFKMEEKVGDLADGGFAATWRSLDAAVTSRAVELAPCRDCALATLCGGGCRSENVGLSGDGARPFCEPWRPRVLAELLAEDRASALEWPVQHLLAEARARGLEAPPALVQLLPSRHLTDTR